MPDAPILIISGTNRPNANALRVARVLLRHYAAINVPAEVYSLDEMPRELFEPSAYATKPASWAATQQRIVAARGLHVVTPEYNGSFPGVLKLFIDMLKFPESFESMPVAFVGEAAGAWGALRSVEQLQQIFAYRNAYLLPQRVFIPGVGTRFSEQGELTDASINDRLREQTAAFAAFTARVRAR